MATQPSASGIVTDETSGERHIPESRRADGSTRKAIKIRPGYRPPEDVEVYKNRTAENFRNRGKGPIPGAEGLKDDKPAQSSSAAANKNAKRREARKKAKAAEEGQGDAAVPAKEAEEEDVDPEAEKEKKVRTLKKKLRQAKELKEKKETGGVAAAGANCQGHQDQRAHSGAGCAGIRCRRRAQGGGGSYRDGGGS